VETIELTPMTAAASTIHHPLGNPAGPGLWRVKGMELPAYIQNVAIAMMRHGKSRSQAIQMATGIVRNWAEGHDGHGHKVSAVVQAAATRAVAQYTAAQGRAHAEHSAGEPVNVLDFASDLVLSTTTGAGGKAGGGGGTRAYNRVPAGNGISSGEFAPKGGSAATAAKANNAKARAKGYGSGKGPAATGKPVSSKGKLTDAEKQQKSQLMAKAKQLTQEAAKLKTDIAALKKQVSEAETQADSTSSAQTSSTASTSTSSTPAASTTSSTPSSTSSSSTAGANTVTAEKAQITSMTAQMNKDLTQAASLRKQAAALSNDMDSISAIELVAPTSTAGRKALAKARNALPDGSFPVPDTAYLKKAIKAVGRAPASKRPALARLIKKRAKELGATNTAGVKGTWAMATPAMSASDGPRMTGMAKTSAMGLNPKQAGAYAKLRKKGMAQPLAMAFAKRIKSKTGAKSMSNEMTLAMSRAGTSVTGPMERTSPSIAPGGIKGGSGSAQGIYNGLRKKGISHGPAMAMAMKHGKGKVTPWGSPMKSGGKMKNLAG
jgi:hypothetical protein